MWQPMKSIQDHRHIYRYVRTEKHWSFKENPTRSTARDRPGPGNSPEKSVHNIVPIVAERAVGPGAYELSLVA